MMKEEHLYSLIEQELNGTLNASDAAKLESWVGQGKEEESTYQEIRSILELTGTVVAAVDPQTDAMWASLQTQLNDEAPEVSTTSEEAVVVPLRRSPARWYGIAAAVVLLVVTSVYLLVPGNNDNDDPQRFSARHGTTLSLDLPDASKVVLNSESSLEWNEDFNDSERRVKLEGEAFFDIAKNKEKPFIINVMGTETKVLGTSFNISAYSGTREVLVSVVTGKVAFESLDDHKSVFLTPNQLGRYDLDSKKLTVVNEVVATDDAAWQKGVLKFNQTPLADALVRLEKHYDLEFQLSPELEGEVMSATYNIRTLQEDGLIEILTLTYPDANIQREGKKVSIMK